MPQENAPARAAIVATRNEADSISATLEALAVAMPGARLLVADDASSDGTGEIAMQHGAVVVGRGRPHGKGGNVSAAAEALLSEGFTGTVLLCDGDLAGSARQLAALVEPVERGDCDIAVASFRRREGGGFGLAVGYARRKIAELSGFEAEAPISGQRAMKAATLRRLLPFDQGWGMEMGMTVDAIRAGLEIKEIELALAHRATGRTFGGFVHRGRQLRDFRRVYRSRR
ncbi:MAG: glycosyltransferase family 2 protein [Solirubrobacterales bacterium]